MDNTPKAKIKNFLINIVERYYWQNHRSVFQCFKMDKGINDLAESYIRLNNKVGVNQSKAEMFFIYTITKKLANLQGSVAEVGVFHGCTAKLISELEETKTIHLFDTFEGFPDQGGGYEKGSMDVDFDAVKFLFRNHSNVVFHKGIYPTTMNELNSSEMFSLVHFDVDRYQETLDGLELFYNRMVTGGCFIFHDYRNIPGVTRAVDEFFADKPEIVLSLFGTQAFVQVLGGFKYS